MNSTNAIGGAVGLALWGGAVGAAAAAAASDSTSSELRPTMIGVTTVGAGLALMGIGLTPGPFQSMSAKARIYAMCAVPLAAGIAGGAALAWQLLED